MFAISLINVSRLRKILTPFWLVPFCILIWTFLRPETVRFARWNGPFQNAKWHVLVSTWLLADCTIVSFYCLFRNILTNIIASHRQSSGFPWLDFLLALDFEFARFIVAEVVESWAKISNNQSRRVRPMIQWHRIVNLFLWLSCFRLMVIIQ